MVQFWPDESRWDLLHKIAMKGKQMHYDKLDPAFLSAMALHFQFKEGKELYLQLRFHYGMYPALNMAINLYCMGGEL